jgi:Amt family ammonium transporter
MGRQIISILVSYALAGIGTFVILKVLDLTIGLRPSEERETQGMDINEHGEEAYGSDISL